LPFELHDMKHRDEHLPDTLIYNWTLFLLHSETYLWMALTCKVLFLHLPHHNRYYPPPTSGYADLKHGYQFHFKMVFGTLSRPSNTHPSPGMKKKKDEKKRTFYSTRILKKKYQFNFSLQKPSTPIISFTFAYF
jgi:hypothetical protein